MGEVIKNEQLTQNQNEIGHVIINYNQHVVPCDVIPINNSKIGTLLVTATNGANENGSLIVQDLEGNILKGLVNLGNDDGVVTADNENIYFFVDNLPEVGKTTFYIFDATDFELKSKRVLDNTDIKDVCCDGEKLYTFDMVGGVVQARDKNGVIISEIDVRWKGHDGASSVSATSVFCTSSGCNYAILGGLDITDEYKEKLASKYGKEIIDENNFCRGFTGDEKTGTTFIARNTLIYVARNNEVKGVLYFPEKIVISISVDTRTNSLIVSLMDKKYNGTLEIIPMSMIDIKMEESDEILRSRNNGQNRIEEGMKRLT